MDDSQPDLPKTLKELNQRLGMHDKRFDTLEQLNAHLTEQLKAHDKRFDQQDKTIANFYAHVERRFDDVDRRFGELDAKIDRLYNLVDQDLKQREVDEHERLAMNHQLGQHEDWIERAADKLDINYHRAG